MEEKEEKIQKLYLEFQELDQKIKQLEQQNSQLSTQLTDLTATVQNLDDIKSIKNGTEILVPISGGIYAKAELKDSKKFIVNVGSNITTVKDVDSTKNLIETQVRSTDS
ncbi:MAG: prefoldin subunit alpha [Nanoarchaeota archaeon]|nr:prefoldin subunit alpha [Nanoarchaeota archaeon]